MTKPVLGLIGCGQMAYALIKAYQSAGEDLFAGLIACDVDAARQDLFAVDFGATTRDLTATVQEAGVLLLAVKPQQLAGVLEAAATDITGDKLLISVAAGVATDKIETWCGSGDARRVIRVMPNIAALASAGVSAVCAGSHALAADIELTERLLKCSGETFIYPESYIDAVGAISGAGPAYVALVLEALTDAAVMLGIARPDAEKMVLATVKGTVALVEQENLAPPLLRQRVCSPGGTTIRAIKKLEEHGLRTGFFEAVQAAYDRSIELGAK
jgi:pyrroline-5-carboxylate reductase